MTHTATFVEFRTLAGSLFRQAYPSLRYDDKLSLQANLSSEDIIYDDIYIRIEDVKGEE